MDALEALYRDNDRLEALRSLLERRTDKAEGADRTDLQLRLAQLYEHSFRDEGAAIGVLRQVLDVDPENTAAQRDLERLFEATGAWDELVALLLSKVGDTPEEAQRACSNGSPTCTNRNATTSMLQFASTHASTPISVPTSARFALSRRLYERKASWTKVADVLERLAARLDAPEAIELCHRVVDLYEQEVGDAEQAGRALRGAYERFPTDQTTT